MVPPGMGGGSGSLARGAELRFRRPGPRPMSLPGVCAGTGPPQGKPDLCRELLQLGQMLQRSVVSLQLLLAPAQLHDQTVASSLTCGQTRVQIRDGRCWASAHRLPPRLERSEERRSSSRGVFRDIKGRERFSFLGFLFTPRLENWDY